MKTKILLFSIITALGGFMNAQYTTGTVSMGSAMTLKVDTDATTVTITLTGPSTGYLALNFVSSGGMSSGSDGFIYNSSSNTDYIYNGLGASPSADASQDWTVTSNTVSGSTRTVVATRSLSGGAGDYAFTNTNSNITLAWAYGSSLNIAYHSARGYTTLARTLGVDDVEGTKINLMVENPVKDYFQFQNAQEISSVTLYDVHGRIISKYNKITEELDATSIKTGVYFMEINTKDGETTYEKIIKE